MAIKGTKAKNDIFLKLKNDYPNAFWEDENKILRIPIEENGEIVEIKVSLTAAKVNLQNSSNNVFDVKKEPEQEVEIAEVTKEEKENINKLLHALNF